MYKTSYLLLFRTILQEGLFLLHLYGGKIIRLQGGGQMGPGAGMRRHLSSPFLVLLCFFLHVSTTFFY